jgi:hypothetical protein
MRSIISKHPIRAEPWSTRGRYRFVCARGVRRHPKVSALALSWCVDINEFVRCYLVSETCEGQGSRVAGAQGGIFCDHAAFLRLRRLARRAGQSPACAAPNQGRRTRDCTTGRSGSYTRKIWLSPHEGLRISAERIFPRDSVEHFGRGGESQMGFYSSVPVAFLMTVFNVRPEWRTGNPRDPKTWIRSSPRIGPFCLLKELFAGPSSAIIP